MPTAGSQMVEITGSRTKRSLAARAFTDTGSSCDCNRGFSAWRGGESKRRRRWAYVGHTSAAIYPVEMSAIDAEKVSIIRS